MKIVNRQEFLELPSGTLYATYTPVFFGELSIKTRSLDNDFCYKSLLDSELCGSELFNVLLNTQPLLKVELNFDTCTSTSRDGLFDNDQLFAVLDKEEHRELINLLEYHYKQLT